MDFSEIQDVLAPLSHVAVISHFRPDGDAIGSTLAMGHALRDMGKTVHLWNEDPLPARYAFLTGADLLQPTPAIWPSELQALICLDTGDAKRLGENGINLLAHAPLTLNIDHHETNTRYADINAVDGRAAACGCVLFELFRAWGVSLTRPISDALYAAISTDTGSFQYSSTTPAVLRMAADLLEAGVNVGDMNRRIYQEIPLSTLIVQREVLNNMVVEEAGAISHYSMPAGKKAELGVALEDTKDIVDIIRVVEGVRVSAIFEDLENGLIRVSLRSKDPRISVSQIASIFGGGGHAMAAGIRMRGELTVCRENVLDAIRAAIRTQS